MFLFIILSSLQLFVRSINGCGFVEFVNGTYFPLNSCVSYRNFDNSFYFSCYGNQLHMVNYYASDCAGIAINISISGYNYECDNPKTCDYIEFNVYPADIGGIDCNGLGEAPYSLPSLINYCYYDRNNHLYKMDTCTDTVWSTFYYPDDLCSGDPYTSQTIDHCDHGSSNSYTDIQTCTTPMNHVADKCGYVQYRKSNRIEPLDVCVEADTFSYMWVCHSSEPFIYYWMDNRCGDLYNTTFTIARVAPIAYSCASNPCNQSLVTTYQTTNCTVSANVNDVTSSTTVPFIIDTCNNWFNANNSMVSEQYFCVEEDGRTSLYGVYYAKPNCDDSEGSHVIVNYTDQCVENGDEQYRIQCGNVLPRTTEIPITTSTDTSSTTTAIPTSVTYAPSPTLTFKNERVLYVTSTGDVSCWVDWTCGTLLYAMRTASTLVSNNYITKVEIIVQGQNAELIKKVVGINPCISHISTQSEVEVLFTEITITFDTDYIHEMSDWYNTDLCESNYPHSPGFFSQSQSQGASPFSLIINNMIFDSYTFEGRSNQPFYIINVHQFTCNYCVFRNITIRSNHSTLDEYTDDGQYPTLISSALIDLHQCEFENIAYELSADVYRFSFIQVHYVIPQNYEATLSLAIRNRTVVTNITHLYRFIDVYMTDGYIVVSDVTFTNITVFDALISHAGEISTITNVRITDTNVYHLALGSIFRVHENTKSFIKIHNMNISTSQTIQHNLNTKQSYGISTLDDYYALFVFESKLDIISVEHVNVKYIYGHYLADNCKSDPIFDWIFAWQMMERDIGKKLDFVHTTMQCNVPIEFVHSVADVDIHHLTVRNDITDTLVDAFKSFIVDEVHQYRGRNKDTVYVHLVFDLEEFTAFIYNDGGALNVEYLTVYGLGAHQRIIFNTNSDLSVNHLVAVPDTYCTLIPCEYDRDSLQIATWVHFAGESQCSDMTLTVSNSYIHGSEFQAIVVGTGYAYLHNVTIQMASLGVHTDTDCMYLEIIECHMMDIGSYYASSTSFLHAYSDIAMPFVLVPSELMISDSVFSYVGPYQFVMFGTATWLDMLTETSGQRKITLLNNLFEINDQNVVTPYPTNYAVDMGRINASTHFLVNGTMHIEREADVTMINNEFRVHPNNLYVSQSVLMDYNLPWIYVANHDDGSICMSGNEFAGFAIYAYHANITSCVKPQLLEYFSTGDCDTSCEQSNDEQINIRNLYEDVLIDYSDLKLLDKQYYDAPKSNETILSNVSVKLFNWTNNDFDDDKLKLMRIPLKWRPTITDTKLYKTELKKYSRNIIRRVRGKYESYINDKNIFERTPLINKYSEFKYSIHYAYEQMINDIPSMGPNLQNQIIKKLNEFKEYLLSNKLLILNADKNYGNVVLHIDYWIELQNDHIKSTGNFIELNNKQNIITQCITRTVFMIKKWKSLFVDTKKIFKWLFSKKYKKIGKLRAIPKTHKSKPCIRPIIDLRDTCITVACNIIKELSRSTLYAAIECTGFQIHCDDVLELGIDLDEQRMKLSDTDIFIISDINSMYDNINTEMLISAIDYIKDEILPLNYINEETHKLWMKAIAIAFEFAVFSFGDKIFKIINSMIQGSTSGGDACSLVLFVHEYRSHTIHKSIKMMRRYKDDLAIIPRDPMKTIQWYESNVIKSIYHFAFEFETEIHRSSADICDITIERHESNTKLKVSKLKNDQKIRTYLQQDSNVIQSCNGIYVTLQIRYIIISNSKLEYDRAKHEFTAILLKAGWSHYDIRHCKHIDYRRRQEIIDKYKKRSSEKKSLYIQNKDKLNITKYAERNGDIIETMHFQKGLTQKEKINKLTNNAMMKLPNEFNAENRIVLYFKYMKTIDK